MDLTLSKTTLAFGEQVTTALLGVDELYRKESGDEEGVVVINNDEEHRFKADAYASYDEAARRWGELRIQAANLPEEDRRRYYDQLCHSTLAFTGQLNDFLHVPPEPASQAALDALRADIRGLLNGMGYSGDLAAQCAAWEARNRVPPDEVPEVLRDLLRIAWDRTEERMHIPAPRSDGMQVIPVSGMAYNARCNFPERRVELNIDPILTLQALKHLTVHECYPGHYVQFKIRQASYLDGTAPADGLLSVVNTASSSPFEGIADNGLSVLDWVENDDDRVQVLLNRYRAGIGTVAAWMLYTQDQPVEKVAGWLRSMTLIGGEGWVQNRMRFISAPSRAVLIWSYWWGEAVVHPVWERIPVEKRSDFLKYLYGRMHSLQTVGMFA
jgi:hypothetical protein